MMCSAEIYISKSSPNLEKADGHEDEAVRGDPAMEDLIEVPLKEELLEDEDELGEDRVASLVLFDELSAPHSIVHVEADVHLHLRVAVGQLHDRHLESPQL